MRRYTMSEDTIAVSPVLATIFMLTLTLIIASSLVIWVQGFINDLPSFDISDYNKRMFMGGNDTIVDGSGSADDDADANADTNAVPYPYSTYTLIFLPPLNTPKIPLDPPENLPIKFKLTNESGEFVRDESVEVKITAPDNSTIFDARYGIGGKDTIIVKDNRYITYWKTYKNMVLGNYTIDVYFGGYILGVRTVEIV